VPHLALSDEDGQGTRIAASWATTGALIDVPPRPRRHPRERRQPQGQPLGRPARPLWQVVLVLYASLALIAAFVITLAFVVARLVTGAAY
jgi:hypothetical protein